MSAPINAITVYPEIENFKIKGICNTKEEKIQKLKSDFSAEKRMKKAISFLKKLVSVCPEFGACLSLFVGKDGLTFEHGKFSFSINPRLLGLDPVCLRMGQIVNISRSWIEKPKEQTYKHAKKAIKSDAVIKHGQGMWSDGTMLCAGNYPNGFKKEEFTTFGDYVRPLVENFNGDNFTRYCTDSINIFEHKQLGKMVNIGEQFYDLHKINFVVKNTSSKKATHFLVHNEGFLAVEKEGKIVAVVCHLNKNTFYEHQLIPCGKWDCKGLSTRPEIDTPLRVAIGLEKSDQPEQEKALDEQLVEEERRQHEPLPEVSEASEPPEPLPQEKHIEHKDVSVGDTVYFSDINDESKRIPANFRGFNGDGTATVIWNGQNMSLPVDRISEHDIEHNMEGLETVNGQPEETCDLKTISWYGCKYASIQFHVKHPKIPLCRQNTKKVKISAKAIISACIESINVNDALINSSIVKLAGKIKPYGLGKNRALFSLFSGSISWNR